MTIGGGFKAVRSVIRYSKQIGPLALWRTLRSKNACKACAFGTGGQKGGFHNEAGRGIEVCNKNIQAHLSDIREGIPNQLFLEKQISELASFTGKQLEDLGRLTTPLYKAAGDKHYSPITYEKGIQICVDKLKASSPNSSFFYASGRSSNEAAFLTQLLARLYGTNNINNCSYYCHQASGVALSETVGTSTATIQYADIEKADCIFVFGANPASNHPRFLKTLIKLRRRGGKVIVVNPAVEPGMVKFASPSDWRSMLKGGEEIASEYVQPHLGGDMAFMQGIAKYILENNGGNKTFIESNTSGFEHFSENLALLSWEEIEKSSGVAFEDISRVGDTYLRAKNTIFCWSMGLTHHTHGVHTIQTLVALALLRGMVGKPGAGLLPLRGHSNIQGTGSMGFTPQLKAAVETHLKEALATTLPQTEGLDTMACMEAADRGEMKNAFMLGGNLLASNPDLSFAKQALSKIPFKCFLNTTINMSHVQGVDQEVLVLPVRARDEELQPTTQESMFNFVRLSDGGINRFAQLRSEVSLICDIGKRLIPKEKFDFSVFENHDKTREFIGKVVPGFGNIKGVNSTKEEFEIDGRILHEPKFATASGKAVFHFYQPPSKDNNQYLLTTVRSEGQFNSIVFHEYDTYRDQKERWVILMNPRDMEEKGYKENDKIDITSNTGTMKSVKVKPFNIRQGNGMVYYPEANILVPKVTDGKSKTPGFKSVPVSLVPEAENKTESGFTNPH